MSWGEGQIFRQYCAIVKAVVEIWKSLLTQITKCMMNYNNKIIGLITMHSSGTTVFPLLPQKCHIDTGHALEKLTVSSFQLFLSPIQLKDQTNTMLESNRFHKLMERFIPQSRPQWKCLPSMEKSVCQHVVHWCLGLQISTERRR